MMIYLSVSICLSVVLLLLPNRYWQFLFEWMTSLYNQMFRCLHIVSFARLSVKGERFLLQMTSLLIMQQIGKIGSATELKEYKFYTNLVKILLDYKRRYGIQLIKILGIIQKGVKKDFQFEKKIETELAGGIFQFILVGLITWVFAYMVYEMVGIKASRFVQLLIMTLQVSGLFIYIYIYTFFKKRMFSVFPIYLNVLFTTISLMEIGLPARKILQVAQWEILDNISDKSLQLINEKLINLIRIWKGGGVSINNELVGVIGEIYFILDERFEHFLKVLGVLKFIVLCFFFLSAYFVYLFTLFHSFTMV